MAAQTLSVFGTLLAGPIETNVCELCEYCMDLDSQMPPKGKSQARSQLMAQKIAAGRHPSRFTQGSLLPENMEPLKIEAMAQRRQHGARQKRSPSPLPIKRISVPSQRALSMTGHAAGR